MLVGNIFALPKDQLSKPIKGLTGVYIVKVTEINAPEPDEQTLIQFRNSLINQKRTEFERAANLALRELADIQDNRHNFGY